MRRYTRAVRLTRAAAYSSKNGNIHVTFFFLRQPSIGLALYIAASKCEPRGTPGETQPWETRDTHTRGGVAGRSLAVAISDPRDALGQYYHFLQSQTVNVHACCLT